MKKTLLAVSITLIAFASCTKEETSSSNNSTPTLTYPSTYRYSGTSNFSAVMTFNQSGQINAPNHPSAADSNFTELINLITEGYSDTATRFSLLSDKLINLHSADFDSTLSYTLSGNKIQIAGAPFYFIVNGNKLNLPAYACVVVRSSGGSTSRQGSAGTLAGTLLDAVKEELDNKPDTAGAKTFNIDFSKK